jgi:hypothetical protein
MRLDNVAEFDEEEYGVVWQRSFYSWDAKAHVRPWVAVNATGVPALPEFRELMTPLLKMAVPVGASAFKNSEQEGVQAGAERLFCAMADYTAPLAARMEFSDGMGKFELGYHVDRERVAAVGYQMAISGYVYVGRSK